MTNLILVLQEMNTAQTEVIILTKNALSYSCKSRLKFPPRVLMWIAISEDGFFCKPFFLEKGNMNGNVYLKKCIKKRLLPFIAQKKEKGRAEDEPAWGPSRTR